MKSGTFNQDPNKKTLKSSLTVLSLFDRTEEKKTNFPLYQINKKKQKKN